MISFGTASLFGCLLPCVESKRSRMHRMKSWQTVLISTALLAAHGQSPSSGNATTSASDSVLPRQVAVPIGLVNRFFPEVTRETSTGQNLTAVDNPKATRSVIYANSDSSKKVTITVDQYVSSADTSSAYQEAVQKSRMVPGFKPISAPNLAPRAFVGTETQGAETHIGAGALDGTLIVAATLAGYEPIPGNVTKLIELIRTEQETAKAVLDTSARLQQRGRSTRLSNRKLRTAIRRESQSASQKTCAQSTRTPPAFATH